MASGIGPLPILLEGMAGVKPLERVFRKSNLPLAVIEHPDQEILMTQMVQLFENASREVGDRLFGLRVGLEMDPAAYGKWTLYASEADHLEDAIHRLGRTFSLHQNMGYMLLETKRETSVWTYIHPTMVSEQGKNHADHILPTMIRIGRNFLGPRWSPKWVRMFYEKDASETAVSDMISTEVRYNGKGVSIAFRHDDLHRKKLVNAPSPLTSGEVFAEAISRKNRGGLSQIEAIIALRLLEGTTDISGVAEMVDVSVRSLQRQFHKEGQTYRTVLDRVRFQRARALLLETPTPVTEIAFLSGFSDPAHFTRSFKRWAGMPPSRFRA